MLDDSWLFLWRVHTHQEEAAFVMRAWGYDYVSELLWRKLTKKTGKPVMGMGRTLRMGHEVCLVGRRGRPPKLSNGIRSIFEAKIGEHSEKPEEFFGIVESFSSGPYVELFARKERPGWTAYGDEIGRAHP
jgi:N6-adenosine-specific RNA methylase IME4